MHLARLYVRKEQSRAPIPSMDLLRALDAAGSPAGKLTGGQAEQRDVRHGLDRTTVLQTLSSIDQMQHAAARLRGDG